MKDYSGDHGFLQDFPWTICFKDFQCKMATEVKPQ